MYNTTIKKNASPFIKWAGGKKRLIEQIKGRFPLWINSNIEEFVYVEPFIGGGAMLFFMLNNYPNIKKAIINDLNKSLTNSYIEIRDNIDNLIYNLRGLEKDYYRLAKEEKQKSFFLEIRSEFNSNLLNELDKTTAFLFLNKTCFNGLYRENKQGLFNVPFGQYKNPKICDEENLIACSEVLQKVEVYNGDYSGVLEHIDTNDAFIYMDPPYRPISQTSSFNSYNSTDFNDNEQIRLKEFCDLLNEKSYSFLLSNSDPMQYNLEDTFFDDLYNEYNIDRIITKRSINSNAENRANQIREILVYNYSV